MLRDPEAVALLAHWRQALADRRSATSDRHAWANAEMAVRFWRLVARDTRAGRPRPTREVGTTTSTATAEFAIEAIP